MKKWMKTVANNFTAAEFIGLANEYFISKLRKMFTERGEQYKQKSSEQNFWKCRRSHCA